MKRVCVREKRESPPLVFYFRSSPLRAPGGAGSGRTQRAIGAFAVATNYQRGAAAERRIASELSGKRTGNTGRAAADVRTTWLAVEVKARRSLPAWLKHAVSQAVGAAGPTWLGIAVLHEHGERYDDALVVMRLGDFRDWFGDLPGGDPPG